MQAGLGSAGSLLWQSAACWEPLARAPRCTRPRRPSRPGERRRQAPAAANPTHLLSMLRDLSRGGARSRDGVVSAGVALMPACMLLVWGGGRGRGAIARLRGRGSADGRGALGLGPQQALGQRRDECGRGAGTRRGRGLLTWRARTGAHGPHRRGVVVGCLAQGRRDAAWLGAPIAPLRWERGRDRVASGYCRRFGSLCGKNTQRGGYGLLQPVWYTRCC
jgi:hypothetical protein